MKRLASYIAPFTVACLACRGAGVNFPTATTCLSPDMRWTIRCDSEKQNGGGFKHTLFLSRLGSSERVVAWVSERSCDVLWQKDGQRLAITDWVGSSVSEVYILEISASVKTTRLDVKNVRDIVGSDELTGHSYYEALEWAGGNDLRIRIFGHTDDYPSHGFAYYLSVDTASGIAKLMKRVGVENG